VNQELREDGLSEEQIAKLQPIISLEGTNDEKLNTIAEVLASSETGLKGVEESRYILDTLKKTGLKNTPVFIQGFLDGDRFRVYDPGLRLPACEYELVLREATGVDVYEALIKYALTGAFPEYLKNVTESRKLNGRIGVCIWIFVRGGTISKINGIQALSNSKGILRIDQRYQEGDRIEDWRDIRNFIFEVAALCEDFTEVQKIIHHIYQTIQILDENGEDMKIVVFDTDRMNTRPWSMQNE
jgi:hypothetical protein